MQFSWKLIAIALMVLVSLLANPVIAGGSDNDKSGKNMKGMRIVKKDSGHGKKYGGHTRKYGGHGEKDSGHKKKDSGNSKKDSGDKKMYDGYMG